MNDYDGVRRLKEGKKEKVAAGTLFMNDYERTGAVK